jgi:hypothetical protein
LASHFKLEEIVTPSNFNDKAEIFGRIGLKERDQGFKIKIDNIINLEEFTFIFKSDASCVMSLMKLCR